MTQCLEHSSASGQAALSGWQEQPQAGPLGSGPRPPPIWSPSWGRSFAHIHAHSGLVGSMKQPCQAPAGHPTPEKWGRHLPTALTESPPWASPWVVCEDRDEEGRTEITSAPSRLPVVKVASAACVTLESYTHPAPSLKLLICEMERSTILRRSLGKGLEAPAAGGTRAPHPAPPPRYTPSRHPGAGCLPLINLHLEPPMQPPPPRGLYI